MKEKEQTQEILAEDCLAEGKKYYSQNQTTEAIKLLLKAKTIAHMTKNEQICAEASNVLGVIYGALGSANMAIDYYLEALKHAQICNYGRILALCMNNIGSRYQDLGQHTKAVEYFHKCESEMEKFGYLDSDKEIPMITVTYLNIIDSYCALGEYSKALEYVDKVGTYILKDPQREYDFAYQIMSCKMKWKTGNKSYVMENLSKLLQRACSKKHNPNYIQNMKNICELLYWMKDYDNWEKLLWSIEEYIRDMDSFHFRMFMIEMWLNYYKETCQTEKYTQKCVEYTEMQQKASAEANIEKASAIDTKIEVYKMEHDRKNAEKKYQQDTLTGVGNRNKLRKDFTVIAEAVRNVHAKLGMAIIDIDYFKSVNDTYGHLKGDDCLVQVASVLENAVAEKGEVYRIGGDEFVLLIPGAEEENLVQIAEGMKQELHKMAIPNAKSKVLPEITISQGYICRHLQEQTSLNDVFREADCVLYKVKDLGRNTYLIEGETTQ